MMKVRSYFYGVLMCTALVACSSEDVVDNGNGNETFGDKAYMSVSIIDAGVGSRATEGKFEDGVKGESGDDVENAHFYFYDEAGYFVTEAEAWDGGKSVSGNGNIEFQGKTTIVLKGLTQKNFPKYLVTVLNEPNGFKPGNTLDEMGKTLSYADGETDGGIYTNQKFIMSTTSYLKDNDDRKAYFVTEVTEKDFLQEAPKKEDITNPVEIYVERLAAKVTLKLAESVEGLSETKTEGLYKMTTATIAGGENQETGSNVTTPVAAEEIYIKFLGWRLNATTRQSNIVKDITGNTNWSSFSFTWNDATNFRSYWGKSYNYGKEDGNYPTDYDKFSQSTNKYINYFGADKGLKELGKPDYCAENTNTADIVKNNPSAVTNAMLVAQICDKDGNALNVVRYNGLLWTEERYINYVLSKTNPNLYWAEIKGEETTYTQVDASYFTLEETDGETKVVLNPNNTKDLYKKGDNNYEKVTTPSFDGSSYKGIAYKDGKMYYNIPIEHLNNKVDENQKKTLEANYGIVRNHHYYITINKIINIGNGIFDPEKEIIPEGNDDNKTIYYVGARINILSWKIVNQGVEL